MRFEFAGFRATTLEDYQAGARRLVSTLDAAELQLLVCIVCGMSNREIATLMVIALESVERSRAVMRKKLNARTTADAVRVGLYAGVDRLN